jgi:hypothetical protein
MAAKNFATSVGYTGTIDPTYYLDVAGLTTFWGKVKDYVNTQDVALRTAVKTKIDNNDAAIRNYIQSLQINGLLVNSDKADGKLGTTLTLTIDGDKIKVLDKKHNNGTDQTPAAEKAWTIGGDWSVNKSARGNSYSDGEFTVESALANVDARLDAVQGELLDGVVSGLIVDTVHGDYTADATDNGKKEWVKVTGKAVDTIPAEESDIPYKTGDLTIVIDDTAINTQFNGIDAKLADLEANAGVTDIKVTDIDNASTTNKGLVEISLKGTKTSDGNAVTDANGLVDTFRRGQVEIILDESGLDQKLDTIDSKISALVSATKFAGTVAWDPTKVTITAVTPEGDLEDYKITGTGIPAEGIIMQNGDIVIVEGSSKEYILDGKAGKFVELGDTTAEQARLTAIEFWVDNNMITDSMINNLKLNGADAWAATAIEAL